MLIHQKVMKRICIWFCMRLQWTPTETFQKMNIAFRRKPMKKRTVFHWHKMFKDGRAKPGDLQRPGQPVTAWTPAAIQQCATLIHNDRRLGIHHLSHTLDVSYGTVFRILHQDLQLTKKAAKFIPHVLTDNQKERRIEFSLEFLDFYSGDLAHNLDWLITCDEAWFHLYEPNTKVENMQWLEKGSDRPQVARRSKSAKKVMMIPFFDSRGLVHCEFFENQTITQEVMLPILTRVMHSIRVRRGRTTYRKLYKYRIHMDNAPAHNALLVTSGLNRMNWERLPHCPYSPDLSPCDFFLFPYLKRKLRGCHFRSTVELKLELEKLMGLIPQHQWKACFKDWVVRCEKCLKLDGCYFEGRNIPE